MIILDTNVISELMKVQPDQRVEDWINGYELELMRLTSISILEIQFGICMMANGKKKKNLQSAFDEMIMMRFQKRIFDFGFDAAIATAKIASSKKKEGRNISIQDLQIIGIALTKGAVIATRNEKDFLNCGITIINPWKQ